MVSKRVYVLLATAAVTATVMLGVIAGPAQAALRHIDGTVISKDASNKTFRVTTQSGAKVRIRVNSATVFQRIAGGFGGLHAGLAVEVEAKQTSNGLLANHVETRSGGGGEGGGGHDDGPNHA
ncbi:MAG TPA: DUF5666 domain-containing protein [Solirubrobacterales bacterium]|nr:DUF5666 domain-containing protein [Solirubrobacterales bacterium]